MGLILLFIAINEKPNKLATLDGIKVFEVFLIHITCKGVSVDFGGKIVICSQMAWLMPW